MRRVKVSILMCDNDSGGFTTGIAKIGDFSEKEYTEKKFNDLIKGIELLEGCSWSFNFDWYDSICCNKCGKTLNPVYMCIKCIGDGINKT